MPGYEMHRDDLLLQQVSLGLFDDHLRHCVADAVAQGGPEANRKLTEATAAVERLLKS